LLAIVSVAQTQSRASSLLQDSAMDQRGKDLRKGRYSEIGQIYLLTAVTDERQPIFADWRMGRLVVNEFALTQEENLAESLAWVVMPDHFHWLVTLQSGSLSSLIQGVKGRSAIAINKCRGGRGQMWQKGYHDRAIRQEEDLREIARYVVANPLRARLVERLGDYPLWDAIWLP
jgi:putative transposase